MAVFTSEEFEKKAVKRQKKQPEIIIASGSVETPARVKNTVAMNFPMAPKGKSFAAFYFNGKEEQVELVDGNYESPIDEIDKYISVGFVNTEISIPPAIKKETRTVFVLSHPDNTPTAGYTGIFKCDGRDFILENGVVKVFDENDKLVLIGKGFNFVREYEEEIQ
jgi:hypothetical protein